MKYIYLFLIPLFFVTPQLANADITMGSGGISDVYVLENGELDPNTFPLRVIEPVSPGYCVNTTGTSGVGEVWDWSSECGAYWINYGDTITVETETNTGNPTQTATFYYNCQDPTATNYDPTWTIDTGECTYPSPTISGISIATTTCTGVDPQTCTTEINEYIGIIFIPIFVIIFILVMIFILQIIGFKNPWREN